VTLCKANGVDICVFPFFGSGTTLSEIIGIINSVFEVGDKKLGIPIIVKIGDVEIWNDCIKPELFIDGEMLKSIKVKYESGNYQLEIWKNSKFMRIELFELYKNLFRDYYYVLVPIDQLSELFKIAEEVYIGGNIIY